MTKYLCRRITCFVDGFAVGDSKTVFLFRRFIVILIVSETYPLQFAHIHIDIVNLIILMFGLHKNEFS